ncbi:MAG: helix-turn-helix domain-containing protein [Desulfurococcales archaeon]|nr:helix-turn-helix domain-containing protein [Desulfurococcales archaeon]
MKVFFEKRIKPKRLISISHREAKALEDPLRALILDLLSTRPMSVEEIWRELSKRGYKKSINTVRHHLNILVSSGLVELVRVEEKRGAHLKYYSSKARLVVAEGSIDEARLRGAIEYAEKEIGRLIEQLEALYGKEIDEEAERLRPCPYCQISHFKEYVILEIIERAIARIWDKKTI